MPTVEATFSWGQRTGGQPYVDVAQACELLASRVRLTSGSRQRERACPIAFALPESAREREAGLRDDDSVWFLQLPNPKGALEQRNGTSGIAARELDLAEPRERVGEVTITLLDLERSLKGIWLPRWFDPETAGPRLGC